MPLTETEAETLREIGQALSDLPKMGQDDIVRSYVHPSGITVRYVEDAVVEESIPLRLCDLENYKGILLRKDCLYPIPVEIVRVSVGNSSMVVKMLDDTGEALDESVSVQFTDISGLEIY